MRHAISETNRRRKAQMAYNLKHNIDPKTIRKSVTDIMAMVRARDGGEDAPTQRGRARGRGRGPQRSAVFDLAGVAPEELGRILQSLQEEMHEAAKELHFEEAARLRDEITELKRELRAAG